MRTPAENREELNAARVVIAVPAAIRRELERRAALERRTLSQMGRIALQSFVEHADGKRD